MTIQPELSPTVANCRHGDSSESVATVAPLYMGRQATVQNPQVTGSTLATGPVTVANQNPPPEPPTVATHIDAEMPTRCAYCADTANLRACCPRHPTTPMCERCRKVPRRPDHHRAPADTYDEATIACSDCQRLIPFRLSWPSTNRRRICVPCLRKVDV